jgi:acetyltransferase-like isoleucine patch superfamily enzyme
MFMEQVGGLYRWWGRVRSWGRSRGITAGLWPTAAKVDWKVENERRIERLRARGIRIGQDCVIFTTEFSTEPYLVELGDRVVVAGGTQFLTHDGAVHLLRPRRPLAQHFGKISVGDNTFLGQNCLVLPGVRIGSDCLIASGSVVASSIPDNSVAAGNPARVVGRASLFIEMLDASPDTIDSLAMSAEEREAVLRNHFALPGKRSSVAGEPGGQS